MAWLVSYAKYIPGEKLVLPIQETVDSERPNAPLNNNAQHNKVFSIDCARTCSINGQMTAEHAFRTGYSALGQRAGEMLVSARRHYEDH